MPQVVQNFVTDRDYNHVRETQQEILRAYQGDFSKHIPAAEQMNVKLVWKNIFGELAKENKKFILGHLRSGARAKDFEVAIAWLASCGLIYQVPAIRKPSVPLISYQVPSMFKLYALDVGLLSAMAKLKPETLISGNEFFKEAKGALTEQYVLQQLMIYRDQLEIAYWAKGHGVGEVDFIVQKDDQIIPVEVKASVNLQAKSLKAYHETFKPQRALRFSGADYKQNELITDYPLYAVPLIMA